MSGNEISIKKFMENGCEAIPLVYLILTPGNFFWLFFVFITEESTLFEFSQRHRLGNNGNIDIIGFTSLKQKIQL